MNKSGYSVTVAYDASSIGEWFNSTLPGKHSESFLMLSKNTNRK